MKVYLIDIALVYGSIGLCMWVFDVWALPFGRHCFGIIFWTISCTVFEPY